MMDRKMRILLSATGLCLCALLILSGLSRRETGGAPKASESSASSASPDRFIVGTFDGLLAVYLSGVSEPEEVYPDVRLTELPQEDRLLLERGIPAASSAQLQRILEDYLN